MMQQMRKTIPKDGLFGQSQADKIYTGMLDDEVAKSVSRGRGLGLAKAMYEQMASLQSDETRKK
jgi:flagellar protein FlgJ